MQLNYSDIINVVKIQNRYKKIFFQTTNNAELLHKPVIIRVLSSILKPRLA